MIRAVLAVACQTYNFNSVIDKVIVYEWTQLYVEALVGIFQNGSVSWHKFPPIFSPSPSFSLSLPSS